MDVNAASRGQESREIGKEKLEGVMGVIGVEHGLDTLMVDNVLELKKTGRKWCKLAREKGGDVADLGETVESTNGKRERDKKEVKGDMEPLNKNVAVDIKLDGWRMARTDEFQSCPAQ